MRRTQRPDLQIMQGAIDILLRHLLRSICTLLAGENATGTLWLCDRSDGLYRVHLSLRKGVVSTGAASGYGCEGGMSLASGELPRSGTPNCMHGYGMEHWISRDLRGFVSLPMILDDQPIGCFVAHLKPFDADPHPENVELARAMTHLAAQAMQIGDCDPRASW